MNGKSIVIRGGRVVDATGERRADVVVEGGEVAAVGEGLSADVELDAGGCLVAPGLVDLHTHLRQPGTEEAETIETGARAAALGGFTCVLAMPNTDPPIDSAGVAREVLELGRGACCEVRTSAAITVGRAGTQLTPMAELAELGVRFFTDDGTGVQDTRLMRRAMEYATGLGVVMAQHCEDAALAGGGHMHEGAWSARLGIPGQPHEAEELMVMRDIALARLTGRPGPLPAPVDPPVGGAGGGGQGRGRGWSAPRPRPTTSRSPTSAARPTTRSSRSTRRCAPTTTWRPSAPGWPTARSTASPPTTPPTRPRRRSCPSTRPRRGCWGSRPPWPWR